MHASLFQSSHSEGPPLRIGLLLDSTVLARCFADMVDHIQQSNFARIELLVFNGSATPEVPAAPPPPRSAARKILDTLADGERRRKLLYTLYQRWDERQNLGDDPLAMVDYAAHLKDIESFSVTPIGKRFVHRFPPEALERIRDKRLDVLIRFGFNILRGDILKAAKHGVWSYHHGDNDSYRGGPAYFWEVYEDNPLSGAILQILTEELDAGQVLCKGIFATYRGLSHARNRLQPYWGSSTFLIQKLRELHEHGWEHLERNMVPPAPYAGRRKIYRTPTNWDMLRWLAPRIATKGLRRLLRKPTVPHWRMALRTAAPPLADSSGTPKVDDFRWLESPKGRFHADPFLIENSGKTWAFFEDYDYSTGLGIISCAEVNASGLGEAVPVLKRPYHLSYPCVFREGDTFYMIPETGSNGQVELYRCTRFPDVWEFDRVLLKAKAVDTTVWKQDGLYWFFTTMQEPRAHASQLWLYSARSLADEWTPHPASPLSTDMRSSRGGGAIFQHNGKLYRPSQDCSREYGGSFTLNEIVVLNRREYREKPHVTVAPSWKGDWTGTHTYAQAGQIELIDGCARFPPGTV